MFEMRTSDCAHCISGSALLFRFVARGKLGVGQAPAQLVFLCRARIRLSFLVAPHLDGLPEHDHVEGMRLK